MIKKIFKYSSYILFAYAIFILSKPILFYAKEFIIQNKLEYEWKQTIKNKKVNPLDPDEYIDDDELFGQGKFCLSCHK